jgi:hypothetical protein
LLIWLCTCCKMVLMLVDLALHLLQNGIDAC